MREERPEILAWVRQASVPSSRPSPARRVMLPLCLKALPVPMRPDVSACPPDIDLFILPACLTAERDDSEATCSPENKHKADENLEERR